MKAPRTEEEALALVEAAAQAADVPETTAAAAAPVATGADEPRAPSASASPVNGKPATPIAKPADGSEAVAPASSARRAELTKAVCIAIPLLFIVGLNYVIDVEQVLPHLTKNREVGADVFWALTLLLALGASYFTMVSSDKDGETLMCVRQTEEAKGWMMFLFLV